MAKKQQRGSLRWVGQEGQFLPGIPARDLTADEVERWPEAAASRLYAPVVDEVKPLPQGEVLPEPEEESGDE